MADSSKTFLITGITSGLGAAFAHAALAAGHTVLGTVRNPEQAVAFAGRVPGRSHGITLNLFNPELIDAAIEKATVASGTIDVLVNCAGYGHEGPLEESPINELRDQMEVNLFAPVALIKAVLPAMRAQRSGHIVNVTSMAGVNGFAGLSYYCASKFALDGLSDALGKELRAFGIFVTSLAPGQFRTNWAGRSMRRTLRSIADYDASFDPVRAARQERDGRQPGDPAKAAQALLTLVAAPNPPSRLFLGTDAMTFAQQKVKRMQAEMVAWQPVSQSTDYLP